MCICIGMCISVYLRHHNFPLSNSSPMVDSQAKPFLVSEEFLKAEREQVGCQAGQAQRRRFL